MITFFCVFFFVGSQSWQRQGQRFILFYLKLTRRRFCCPWNIFFFWNFFPSLFFFFLIFYQRNRFIKAWSPRPLRESSLLVKKRFNVWFFLFFFCLSLLLTLKRFLGLEIGKAIIARRSESFLNPRMYLLKVI